MVTLIVLNWPLISFAMAFAAFVVSLLVSMLMMLVFYFPVLVGAIFVIRFLGKPQYAAAIFFASVALDLLLIWLALFDPFAKQADQPTLIYGMFATACVGLLVGCGIYIRISEPCSKLVLKR